MNLKLYNSSLVFQKTFGIKDEITGKGSLKNSIKITNQVDGGPGRLSLNLDLPYGNNEFNYGDVVKIFDLDINENEICLYSGTIEDITRTADNYEEITIECIGYTGLLSKLIYEETDNYTVSKNDTVSNILNDLLDYFDLEYSGYISSRDIATTNTVITYNFNYTDILKAIKDLVKLEENYYFIIKPDGTFKFANKNNANIERLTFEKDLFGIESEEDGTDIVNRIILDYNGNIGVYNYGTGPRRTIKLTNNNIGDSTTAQAYADSYYSKYQDPIKKIQATINNNYSYEASSGSFWSSPLSEYWSVPLSTVWTKQLGESVIITKDIFGIVPGDKIKILNFSEDLGELFISKTEYGINTTKLWIEDFDNLIQLIKE